MDFVGDNVIEVVVYEPVLIDSILSNVFFGSMRAFGQRPVVTLYSATLHASRDRIGIGFRRIGLTTNSIHVRIREYTTLYFRGKSGAVGIEVREFEDFRRELGRIGSACGLGKLGRVVPVGSGEESNTRSNQWFASKDKWVIELRRTSSALTGDQIR